MPQAVIFETPGLIDMRAFTMLGAHAKPNTHSPIGYFGTGLKYAIAVLVRNEIPVTLWRGMEKYTFHLKQVDFRGTTLELIELRRDKGLWNTKTELPYTTQFGKNWELWQAFRELYSNTVDEGGATGIANFPEDAATEGLPSRDRTLIIVEGADFANEFIEKDKTFLPEALTNKIVEYPYDIEYFLNPSNYVYYRGMRVMELDKPSVVTYNFLKMIDLTEDRTAKYTYCLEVDIARFVLESADEKLIEVVASAPTSSYESRLNFSDAYTAPSATFSATIHTLHAAKRTFSPTAKDVVERYDPDHVIEPEYPWLSNFIEHLQHADINDNIWLEDHVEELIQHCDALIEILQSVDNT